MKFKAKIIIIFLLLTASSLLIFLLFYFSRTKPVEVSKRPLILASFLYEHGEKDLAKKQREKIFQITNDLYRNITGDFRLIDVTEDVSASKYSDKFFSFAFPLEQFLATVDLSQEINNNNFSYSRALADRSAEKFIYVEQDQSYDLYFKTKSHSESLIINSEEKIANDTVFDWKVISNYYSGDNKVLTFKSAIDDDQLVEVVLVTDRNLMNKSGQRRSVLVRQNKSYFFDLSGEDFVITHNPQNIFLSPVKCADSCENPKFLFYYQADSNYVSTDKKAMGIITAGGSYQAHNYNFSKSLIFSIFILIIDAFLVLLLTKEDFKKYFVTYLVNLMNKQKKIIYHNKTKILKIIFLNISIFILRFIPLFRPYFPILLILSINIFLIWFFFRSKRLLSLLAGLSILIVATLNSLYLLENLVEKFATAIVFLLVFVLLETIIDLFNNPTRKICD